MSNLLTRLRRHVAVAGAMLLLAPALSAQEAQRANTLRPEVGKPLQAAIDLLKAHKNKEALAKVGEAEAIANRNDYEEYLLQRIRGQAAAAAGVPAIAARSLEAAAGSSAAPAGDRQSLLAGAAGQYYQLKDYRKAVDLLDRYAGAGGQDAALRMLLVQSLYLGGDFQRADRELRGILKDQAAAGKPAMEDQLQLSLAICQKLQDSQCVGEALEGLLSVSPKSDYWLSAIYELSRSSGFPARYRMEVARLKLLTQTMRTGDEYFEAAQLSMQEGFPVEAQSIIRRGYEAGLLGTGADADRHGRLRDMVARAVAEDDKTLGSEDAAAAGAPNGMLLLNTGFNYVLRGQHEKGLGLMENGIRKGGFKRAEDAQLRLGIAQTLAGRGSAAVDTFSAIRGKAGASELARLWAIAARRSTASPN